MARSKVDRLTRALADLEGKIASERGKATDERSKAAKALKSITRSTSPSSTGQKQRTAEGHEKKALGHDQKVATLAADLARRRSDLSSAEEALARELKRQSDKEERESARRRRDDRRHLDEIERRRRASTDWLPSGDNWVRSRLDWGRGATMQHPRERESSRQDRIEFDVCLSFAGEDRPYVELVAKELKDRGVTVFYDENQRAVLWGKNLAEELDRIYRKASRYCVAFISQHYARKQWARHERRSAMARAVREDDEYLLPVRFDDTELDGLQTDVAYIDLRQVAPASLAELLVAKLGISDTRDAG